MSLIDGLHRLFQSGTCVKLVVYQARAIEFSGLEGTVGGAKFSLADFKLNTKMVQTASEMAKALDDYQYIACQLARELTKQDPEWKAQFKLRSAAILLITKARVVLEAYRLDPGNQADNLDSLVKQMLHFNDNIVKPVPEVRRELESLPGKRLTAPRIDPIAYALQFVGVNENDLDRMIASL